MKKLITLAVALVITASASAQSGWRVGVTLGSFGNRSVYSGGDMTANALFTHQKYNSGMLGVLFRKQLTSHISVQTGINFSSLGFNYGMARDYSLTMPKSHYMQNQVSIGTTSIPATFIWNFNPNCKNVRWFVGPGISWVAGGNSSNQSKSTEASKSEAANLGITSGAHMTQSVSASPFITLNAHLMFGVEKMYKRGTMLSLAFWFNKGFSPLATSTVTYNVNGQDYTHKFTNYNNYAGLTLSYYFKPITSRKAKVTATASSIKPAAPVAQ
ncbi:MAG: outer membrane beta-barrel protein [Bacteroidia bacterium]